MIKAIALDDEPLALRILSAFCMDHKEINLLATFTEVSKAEEFMEVNPVDLLFVDIQMPAKNGIDLVRNLSRKPAVVFTTAFSDYAVEGFNLDAVDYLLKPFTEERFSQCIEKVSAFINGKQEVQPLGSDNLFLKSGHSQVKLNPDQIMYIEGYDDYLKIHRDGLGPLVVRMTMKNILQTLPEGRFIRVHKSFIVPVARVSRILSGSVIVSEKEIPVGKMYRDELKSLL